ncbi:hypothetical protein JKF63_07732 [Porcisia hertigi]|uniref:TLDc domain-containing protein n=1 Tax=Porcisia hertigi TaxID=2761500 RepID=A0A836YGX8_9TRYP|nr:hypothetical protein JKF63_07732 [Porcisia hertigi]
MECPPIDTVCGDAATTTTVTSCTFVDENPNGQTATPPTATPLTDTKLLQRALRNAIASAATGKAIVAAHNYALVLKILFRKCFLLDELVLLALAMGHEARKAEEAAAAAPPPPPPAHGPRKNSRSGDTAQNDTPNADGAAQQLVDALENIGMLLPPGLDDDEDYNNERAYSAQRESHEKQSRPQNASTHPTSRGRASSASAVPSANTAGDDAAPGYDAATAQWLACLLAKVRSGALPISTIDKIGKAPLASTPARSSAAGSQQPASATPGACTASAYSGLPHLMSSPTQTLSGVASPTGSPNQSDATVASATTAALAASLPVLIATLLWDVACVLWNEGFVEDAHHWLSAVDVRQLWKLYKDLCRSTKVAAGGCPEQPAAPSSSTLFSSTEPLEEGVHSDDRACPLDWTAVLAESRAADEPESSHHRSSPPPATMAGFPPLGSGITLSAVAARAKSLPMTNSVACFDDVAWLEGNSQDNDGAAAGDEAATGTTQSNAEKTHVGIGGPSTDTATSSAALACFVRRLARRTSALRDLCGLMIACETAEDVFYMLYALNGALVTQQQKYEQQQERQRADEAAADHDGGTPLEATCAPAMRRAATTATTTSGGLPELLIITNLLVEFFIAKRAQRLLLEEGALRPLPAHQQRLTDRAIRRACDEVVCAFTNGHCLTLYALESYGIPPPYDDGGGNQTLAAHMLAPELPHVLVINVLSSTLNYAALYHCSKVFQGVMRCSSSIAAQCHYDPNTGCASPPSSAVAAAATPLASNHPNRTRRPTEHDMERRRMWTGAPTETPDQQRTAPPPHACNPPSPTPTTLAIVSTNTGDGVSRSAVSGIGRDMDSDHIDLSSHHHHHHQDVRPSFFMGEPPGEDALLGRHGSGGYAERLAAARRKHQAVMEDGSRKAHVGLSETMPWSAESPTRVTSNNSNLEDASSTSGAHLGKADLDARHTASAAASLSSSHSRRGGRGYWHGLKTRGGGTGTSELLLPCSSSALTLLCEEREAESLYSDMDVAAVRSTSGDTHPQQQQQQQQKQSLSAAPFTVLHTTAAQLQSRTPSEAVCLRLLALLYRYPLLHTLQPVTASHVGLVAKELNKALHILQTAMRGRFGDGWWMQWRSKRESETQRYYARALADAQRGGNLFCSPTASCASSPPTAAGAAAGASVVSEQTFPPRMPDTSALQPGAPSIFAEASSWLASITRQQGKTNAMRTHAGGFGGSPLASASPPPPPPQPHGSSQVEPALPSLWNTHILRRPAGEVLRKTRREVWQQQGQQQQRGEDATPNTKLSHGVASTETTTVSSASRTTMPGDAHEAEMVYDVNWDVPPAYTPDVSLDFSAFTTSSVETQESTRRLVESMQQREQAQCKHDKDDDDDDDDGDNHNSCNEAVEEPGVSVLSRACRRLLHDELPLLQQYCPWRVIYSTRMHGVSLSTLLANCRREMELESRHGYGATSATSTPVNSKPMLLVLELPSSTTFKFDDDDAGVREAWGADPDTPTSAPLAFPTAQSSSHKEADDGDHAHDRDDNPNRRKKKNRNHKLFIGAYLSDLLQIESRRYYGNGDCFVFQLLVPGTVGSEEVTTGAAHADPHSPSSPGAIAASRRPQLRVHHSSHRNTQYVNCRTTSIVIGGGGGGSSIYLDESLRHGATNACPTFSSPPLSTWVSKPCTAAGACADGESDDCAGQKSLCVMNVEVIVMDA